jgi:two-component system, sensor histidine kinase
MEDFLTAQLLLTESEFLAEVSSNTAALVVDLTTGRIVYATGAAEKLFSCRVKNGLNGTPFEGLIPSELRGKHLKHVEAYARNPRPRAMGDAMMKLRALTLDGDSFPVAIDLQPIKKAERLYVIVKFMSLPNQEAK